MMKNEQQKAGIYVDKVMKAIYETMMIALVILTIMTLWMESAYNSAINWIVWFIFFCDFLIRLVIAKNKWQFIKTNPFLIIAIIPLDQFFQMARIVRLLYFYRIKTIAKYYITPYVRRLTSQSIIFFTGLFLLLLSLKATIVWNLEKAVSTYPEALSVVFGHLFFFGHRIFMIEQPFSITLLTIVSIFGVVLQGLALQWAFGRAERIYTTIRNRQNRAS